MKISKNSKSVHNITINGTKFHIFVERDGTSQVRATLRVIGANLDGQSLDVLLSSENIGELALLCAIAKLEIEKLPPVEKQ